VAGMSFNVGGFNIGSRVAGVGGAKKGCGGGCGAVFGIILGIIMIPLGLYLAYYGEIKLVNHGKVFERIEMMEPDAAKAQEGELVKISGQPEGIFLRIREWDGQALFVRRQTEEFQEDTDAEGEVEREWNTIDTDEEWADFSIGSIQIRPAGANPVGEEEVYSAYKKKYETAFHVGTSQDNPDVGDQRLTIDVLDATNSVIVLGQMSGGGIQGGSTFVVSTQNEGQTMQTLKTEYTFAYWGLKGGAVFAIFFGILMVFTPLTWLVGHVPLIGNQLSCAFAGVAFVIAVVTVGVITVFLKAFWFLVAAAVLVIAFVIIRGITTSRSGPGAGPPVQPAGTPPPAQPVASIPTAQPTAPAQPRESAEPEAGPKFCANCGAELDPGGKFCQECGHQVGAE